MRAVAVGACCINLQLEDAAGESCGSVHCARSIINPNRAPTARLDPTDTNRYCPKQRGLPQEPSNVATKGWLGLVPVLVPVPVPVLVAMLVAVLVPVAMLANRVSR
jgi:hypothetical protein